MTNERKEFLDKLDKGLKLAYQKMLDFKIYKGTKVAISDKNGNVILVDPKDLKK